MSRKRQRLRLADGRPTSLWVPVIWQVTASLIGGGLLLITALVWGLWTRQRHRAQTRLTSEISPSPPGAVAIIANPTKHGIAELHDMAIEMCRERGLGTPIWLQTTADSPGTTQAAQIIRDHPNIQVAVAAGGDGTVRAVAGALAGTKVPLGIVPMGTANLLARNLKLPLNSAQAALDQALSGHERTIDVGRVSTWDAAGTPVLRAEVFLVIAGLGFDAEMVGSTAPKLKARLGWPAYIISGINHLSAKPVKVRLTQGNTQRGVYARSVMFGNCGMLPAHLTLVPDADLSDGLLDLAMAETRHGLVGWAALALQVALHGLGIRWVPAWASGRLWYEQAPHFLAECNAEYKVQLDGELAGRAKTVEAWVDPLAITVRVPPRG
ncbi:MAG: NAD(+)/NADH kinase [Micrococcales bacterium]|nr:NAD(+)/NADH kinase [Micrococcales bacterium]